MKKTLLFFVLVVFGGTIWAQTYVGPEKCLTCHVNPTGVPSDKTGWRNTLHANGYSAVLDDTYSMVIEKGVVADYDQNGVDDFKDGLNFNNISSAFDVYKPNAPILGYDATNGYTITIGEVTSRVYLTYGGSGMWKQRYALRINTAQGESKDLYISPIQYNETTHEYVLYHPDAWYDSNNLPVFKSTSTLADAATNSRSLAKGCSGCHATGLTLDQTTDGEWVAHPAGVDENIAAFQNNPSYFDLDQDGHLDQINTGCERCHGPGGDHASTGDKTKINNPADFTVDEVNNLCGMCHSRGKSKPNNTFSFAYNDADMISPELGDMVDDFYTDGGGYWGDGKTSKSHHQQFRDFYKSVMATNAMEQVACYSCHDPHGSKNEHMVVEEVEEEDANGNPIVIPTDVDNNTLCLSCHSTHGDFQGISKEMVVDYANNVSAIGAIVSEHSRHPYDPEGDGTSRCTNCHMPKVAKSAVEYDIHSHTFIPIGPENTKLYNMPNSCAVSCHAKTNYPNFGIAMTSADFTDWAGTNQQALADSLLHYYGPNGIWWNLTSVHFTDLETPKNFELNQNYPNPFNPSTKISFAIPTQSHVKLTVYDALGNEIAVLVDETKTAGNYYAVWNAANNASGVYFYRLDSDNFTQVRKMMLVK